MLAGGVFLVPGAGGERGAGGGGRAGRGRLLAQNAGRLIRRAAGGVERQQRVPGETLRPMKNELGNDKTRMSFRLSSSSVVFCLLVILFLFCLLCLTLFSLFHFMLYYVSRSVIFYFIFIIGHFRN